MSDGIARAALFGEDHETLGHVATETVGAHGALALTRGKHVKTYRYEDPNEDVVALVAGPDAVLIVVADGHHGKLSSHVAVRALVDAVGEPPATLSGSDWLELFGAANDAIVSAKGLTSPQAASETVLAAALAVADRVSFAAIGDAALVLAAPGTDRGRQLNREGSRFLGRPMKGRELKAAVGRGDARRAPDEWLFGVTDGLSAFIDPLKPADLLPRLAAARDATPESVARAVADAAGDAGAGDNVGVVVHASP